MEPRMVCVRPAAAPLGGPCRTLICLSSLDDASMKPRRCAEAIYDFERFVVFVKDITVKHTVCFPVDSARPRGDVCAFHICHNISNECIKCIDSAQITRIDSYELSMGICQGFNPWANVIMSTHSCFCHS